MTLIILEGISYYIPPTLFWKTLKTLKQNIQSDCFICGDFLVDETKQKISKISQNLSRDIFGIIKKTCAQNYYTWTTKQTKQNLESLNFSKVQFFYTGSNSKKTDRKV